MEDAKLYVKNLIESSSKKNSEVKLQMQGAKNAEKQPIFTSLE